MSYSLRDARMRISFESNKTFLKIISNFYISEPRKHKVCNSFFKLILIRILETYFDFGERGWDYLKYIWR